MSFPANRVRCVLVVIFVLAFVLLSAGSLSCRAPGGDLPVDIDPVDDDPAGETVRIGDIELEPEGDPGPGGVMLIPEGVVVSVEAEGARKVEFYAAPEEEEGPGTVFWSDDRPENGWETYWEAPLANTVFRLTAVAHGDDATASNSIRVMWKAEEEVQFAEPVEEGEGFRLVDERSRIYHLAGVPRYFMAEGWVDEKNIFGLAGTNPLVYNLEEAATESLGVTAWGAWLSPDGRRVAYRKEDGIHLVNIDGSGKRFLWPEEGAEIFGGDPGGSFWSPDGSRLLVWYQYEWDSEFFIYHLDSGKVEPFSTHLEDYFLTSAVGWADNRRIIFTTRASRMKDGTGEYSHGYRSDLAVYDTAAGTFRLITGARDGEFIEGLSASANGILFLRWRQSGETASCGLMDISGRVLWEEDPGRIISAALSPDGRALAYVVEKGSRGIDRLCRLVVKEGDRVTEVAELQVEQLRGPYWSPGGLLLVSFSSSIPQHDRPGSYRSHYSTLVVKP